MFRLSGGIGHQLFSIKMNSVKEMLSEKSVESNRMKQKKTKWRRNVRY